MVAVSFLCVPIYLHVLVGLITVGLCTTMLCVAIETPKPVIERLEQSLIGEKLFTFRGRYMMDVLIVLFLFAMRPWGYVTGTLTLLIIFGIRFLGVKQPDAFNEIFRQSDIESQADEYTLESEYDTPVAEKR